MAYNYTIPRGPVAAMYKSPGPIYSLPPLTGQVQHDPRSVHLKEPAYSFGIRTPPYGKDCSPGPKYNPNAKIYRDGKDGSPHFSMAGRFSGPKPFSGPGPAAYSPEKSFPTSTHPTAPVYSMHDRTALANKFKTPGGIVDSTKPTKPLYSMAPRSNRGSFSEDLAKAPGPGTYNTTKPSVYKRKMPEYTLGPRVFPPGDTSVKPGPGTYRPEDPGSQEASQLAHTAMDTCCTHPRRPIAAMYTSPGPQYVLPNLLGQQDHDPRSTHRRQPAFSFGGLRHAAQARRVSPGFRVLTDKVQR
ncbi:ciliary microtubule associated protein 1A-like [Babylonia areolata]|uniref:ciliary microtubule associated protein 1A-like n=1 Tax=Babylonia areolata TaxID=304850 RepID=UPI003FD19914